MRMLPFYGARHSNNFHMSCQGKIHVDSCGNARNVRRNKPLDSEGCGLQGARKKRSGFFRFRCRDLYKVPGTQTICGKHPPVAEINGSIYYF